MVVEINIIRQQAEIKKILVPGKGVLVLRVKKENLLSVFDADRENPTRG